MTLAGRSRSEYHYSSGIAASRARHSVEDRPIVEPAHPHRSRRGPVHPVSVAELVSLHSGPPGARVRVTETGPPLSVGTLLRREGRAPHAFDRPTVLRGHSRPPQEPPTPPARGARKASAATGALLMVGAVLGTAVVNESVVVSPDTPGTDGGPAAGAGVADPAAGSAHSAPAVAVAFIGPLSSQVPVESGVFDLPVASGASIGRGALGGPSAGGPATVAPAAPGVVEPLPVVVIPQPRPPVENQPGLSTPVGPGPAATQPAPQQQPPPLTVTPPSAGTPVVEVPSVAAPTALGPVHTPTVSVSPAKVTPPAASVSTSDGLKVATTTPAEVVTPDIGVGHVQAGPFALSRTKVDLPDVKVSKAAVGLSPDGADVTLPGVSVSPTTLTTPDVKLGRFDVSLPDVSLPAVDLPAVSPPVAGPVRAVTGVVGGLLGGK